MYSKSLLCRSILHFREIAGLYQMMGPESRSTSSQKRGSRPECICNFERNSESTSREQETVVKKWKRVRRLELSLHRYILRSLFLTTFSMEFKACVTFQKKKLNGQLDHLISTLDAFVSWPCPWKVFVKFLSLIYLKKTGFPSISFSKGFSSSVRKTQRLRIFCHIASNSTPKNKMHIQNLIELPPITQNCFLRSASQFNLIDPSTGTLHISAWKCATELRAMQTGRIKSA